MHQKHIHLLIVLLTLLALTFSACGSSASNQSVIATSVAMTVQAQNAQEAQRTPTLSPATDLPPLLAPPAPGATKAPPTAPAGGSANNFCTASASIVDANYPDGTIINQGDQFTKMWRVTNTGTCAWDSTWKIVFSSGDLMGGAYTYPFPQPAQPGETVDVPVVFYAPTADGGYQGNWDLVSPWGTTFASFWVKIVVGSGTPENNKTATVYDVTAVTYDVSYSCAASGANQFNTVTAYISTNGPLTVIFTWEQSDGNNKANNKVTFTAAGTKSVTREWNWGRAASANPRWMKVIITSPTYQEYGQATLLTKCW